MTRTIEVSHMKKDGRRCIRAHPLPGDVAMSLIPSAPKQVTWIICLVLYLVALAAQFGDFGITGTLAPWAWIIGFGVLLLASRVRGL